MVVKLQFSCGVRSGIFVCCCKFDFSGWLLWSFTHFVKVSESGSKGCISLSIESYTFYAFFHGMKISFCSESVEDVLQSGALRWRRRKRVCLS